MKYSFVSKVCRGDPEKFCMGNYKSMSTPMCQKQKLCKDDGTTKVDEFEYRSLVGCLMYLTTTRSDIMYVVSVLSRFMNCANGSHLRAAKRVLRYVKGTVSFGVKFCLTPSFELQGYSDSDWARSLDDMKNTSVFCFNFGLGIFTWSSKKQEIVTQSTVEAKFIAATTFVNHVLWLRKILNDLHLEQKT